MGSLTERLRRRRFLAEQADFIASLGDPILQEDERGLYIAGFHGAALTNWANDQRLAPHFKTRALLARLFIAAALADQAGDRSLARAPDPMDALRLHVTESIRRM